MENKGQSALEYLMTYGWALVVIVIVIAALFAFGIFNPPSTGTCTGLDKLAYKDHGYDSTNNKFEIALANGAGSNITVTSATISDGSVNGDMNVENSSWTLGADNNFSYNGAVDSPVTVTITYTSGSGITHVETANCTFG